LVVLDDPRLQVVDLVDHRSLAGCTACTISAPGSESPPGRGGGAEHRVGRVLSGFASGGKRDYVLRPEHARRVSAPGSPAFASPADAL
jgi:hypothetical protein